jgi:hypothetical protein
MEILLHKYTLNDDLSESGTYPYFVQGGQVATYWDDVSEAIKLRDFSSQTLITSGPLMSYSNLRALEPRLPSGEGMVFIVLAIYQFCDAQDLINFSFQVLHPQAFPYTVKNRSANNASCTVTFCDLLVTDVQVDNESFAGAMDGQITVTATSTNSIQYGLLDFNYGAGQTSNIFSGLSAGNYTVWAVDEFQCKQSISVSVRVISIGDYGLLYRVGYQDLHGNDARFDIKKSGYSGSSTEITSGAVPVRYSLNEPDQFDVFSTIRPSHVTVVLPEITNFQYRELYTTDSKEYLGIWSKDTGSGYTELWRGFLEPQVFNANYTSFTDVSLTFTDGLGSLSEFKYGEGSKFYDDIKLIKAISKVLQTTNLELPIHVGVNIYEDSHNATDSDDPLDQTYIDQEAFYDDEGEALNYEEVLKKKLDPFAVKLLQWNAAFWIVRQEELIGDFDYRVFTKRGDYSSNATRSPKKELRRSCVTDARAVWVDQDAVYEILPPAKKIILINKLKARQSILENHDFNRDRIGATWESIEGWTFIQGEAGTSGRGNRWPPHDSLFYSISHSPSVAYTANSYVFQNHSIQYTSGDQLVLSFRAAMSDVTPSYPYQIIRVLIKVGNLYLHEGGFWDSSFAIYRFYHGLDSTFKEIKLEIDLPSTTEIKDEAFQIRFYDLNTIIPDFGVVTYDFPTDLGTDGVNDLIAFSSVTLPIGARRSVYRSNQIFFFELKDGNLSSYPPDLSEIRPTDYNASTNNVYWEKTNLVDLYVRAGKDNRFSNRTYIFDDVKAVILTSGQNAAEEEKISVEVNPRHTSDYNYEITASDLPSTYISSGKYLYDSLFKLSNGTNTGNWTRDGVSESLPIQQVLVKTLARQYSTATGKLSGTLTTLNRGGTHMDITPLDSIVETQDGGKIYYINGLTIDDKNLLYQVSLIDSKATSSFGVATGTCDGGAGDPSGGDDDDGGAGAPFSGGFSSGFGGGFDTILN